MVNSVPKIPDSFASKWVSPRNIALQVTQQPMNVWLQIEQSLLDLYLRNIRILQDMFQLKERILLSSFIKLKRSTDLRPTPLIA